LGRRLVGGINEKQTVELFANVRLSQHEDAEPGDADITQGTVVIDDNMPMLELVGTATNASENAEQPGIITVKRRGDPEIDFTAYVTIGGTATFGVDYPAFQTNVFFCCGVTSIDLTITPTNELVIEGTESQLEREITAQACVQPRADGNRQIVGQLGFTEFALVN
jgi:hypothetical protein